MCPAVLILVRHWNQHTLKKWHSANVNIDWKTWNRYTNIRHYTNVNVHWETWNSYTKVLGERSGSFWRQGTAIHSGAKLQGHAFRTAPHL